MLSKFQTCVSWNSRSRGQDVKKFGTRAGIRIFVLQCSHNFKTNAAETTGKQEAKLFESNAQHLLIYIYQMWLEETYPNAGVNPP